MMLRALPRSLMARGRAPKGALFAALAALMLLGASDGARTRSAAALAALGVAPALAAHAAPTGGAVVALLATVPGAGSSTLHHAAPGADRASPPLSTLKHLPDAVVRATVVPGTRTILATADTSTSRDASFNASLFRMDPSTEPVRLCDRVVHASRPLATASGRVFIARGVAGPEPNAQHGATLRIDALTIDEVDLASGAIRTVHAHRGYLAFLAGAWRDEILVYRISPMHADLVAVRPDSGAVRMLVPTLLPFARDFSIDSALGTLIFQERDESDPGLWVVDRIDLSTGARSRLISSRNHGLAPHAWPGGGIAASDARHTGLVVLGAPIAVRAPLGPGVDAIHAVTADGSWVAALHTSPGAFAVPFAVSVRSGVVAAVPAPSGARIAIAGFVAGTNGAR